MRITAGIICCNHRFVRSGAVPKFSLNTSVSYQRARLVRSKLFVIRNPMCVKPMRTSNPYACEYFDLVVLVPAARSGREFIRSVPGRGPAARTRGSHGGTDSFKPETVPTPEIFRGMAVEQPGSRDFGHPPAGRVTAEVIIRGYFRIALTSSVSCPVHSSGKSFNKSPEDLRSSIAFKNHSRIPVTFPPLSAPDEVEVRHIRRIDP